MSLLGVEPRTENQSKVFEAWQNGTDNLLMTGSAGTGKTFLAIYLGLKEVEAGNADKVIVIRSAVPSRDMGYLPGGIEDKSEIYEEPLFDVCAGLFGRADAYEILRNKRVIEFQTTSFLRGLTFRDSVVIFDEVQNAAKSEINTVFTRIGEGCRLIVCGDGGQADTKTHEMKYIKDVVHKMDCFAHIEFGLDDIVRSGFVRSFLIAKETLGY